jgi:hypothetical protein
MLEPRMPVSRATAVAEHKKIKAKQVSWFLGCYTHNYADKWTKYSKLKLKERLIKDDFGVVDRASPFKNIIQRIEKTPTSVGNTGWTQFHSVP